MHVSTLFTSFNVSKFTQTFLSLSCTLWARLSICLSVWFACLAMTGIMMFVLVHWTFVFDLFVRPYKFKFNFSQRLFSLLFQRSTEWSVDENFKSRRRRIIPQIDPQADHVILQLLSPSWARSPERLPENFTVNQSSSSTPSIILSPLFFCRTIT